MAKVSIIVPVYKVESSIKKCVDSLLQQTLKDIEIILVDDGSPDNCPQLCDEYAKKDNRVKVIHKKNAGLGYARNSGLEIAQGEFIGFVDSDDFVDQEMFKKLYDIAIEEKADATYTGFYNVNNGKIISAHSFTDKILVWNGKQEVRRFLMDLIASEVDCLEDAKYGATVWKGIFRRSLIQKFSLKFYSEREYVSEDGLFDIDFLTKANKVVMIPGCYYYYLYNPPSLTAVYRDKRFEQNKALYKLGQEKLWNAYYDKNILKQYGRMFIAASRVCIMQEVNHMKINGVKQTYQNIKDICRDEILDEILTYYPWKKFTFKKKVFTFFMKNKMIFPQIILIKLSQII